MLSDMFKKTKYITLTDNDKINSRRTNVEKDVKIVDKEPYIPDGMWIKCSSCGSSIYTEDLIKETYTCPKCNHHLRMTAEKRLDSIIDDNTFEEWDTELTTKNVLDFPEYENKISKLQSKVGLKEAVVSGVGKVYGEKVVIVVMDSRFMMGSMGSIVGEKVTRAVERATKMRLPVVIFTASGGARMQEGIISLMQMAKTSAALAKHSEAGLLYLSVLTDPTTGGVTASFAMLGDIIIAEPGALVGFAGPRVIKQTIGQDLPEGFQRAEFLLEHGLIDKIVERKKMKGTIHQILILHKEAEVC